MQASMLEASDVNSPSNIEALPDDVLVRILSLLQPCQLHWTERVNQRFRSTVIQHNLWRSHCSEGCSNFEDTVRDVDIQSLQQIITDLREMAALEDKALAEPPSSIFSLMGPWHLRGSNHSPGSSPVLRSDNDLQHSRPPTTVSPFWGPGLSLAAADGNLSTSTSTLPTGIEPSHSQSPWPETNVNASSSTHASPESQPDQAAPSRPRLYSRDGNLSTSRDTSRDSSTHGGNSLWQQLNVSITRDVLRSMFYKRLCWRLGARPAEESLIAKAVQASSTDNVEESIQNVLQPDTRRLALWVTYSYWSSAASEDADSIETLDFELAHPLCLVSQVLIRPFKADFQLGSPIYPSKQVRFHFGTLGPRSHADSPAKFHAVYSSPMYPMQHTSDLQSFPLPSVMAVGGVMRVELIGRMQRQPAPADNRFYTCIAYLKVVGTPLYGFEPCDGHLGLTQSAPQIASAASAPNRRAVVLKAVWPDPLTQAGGLLHVSEMGRLRNHNHVAAHDAASDDEEGQHALHGDSDDGDFAQEQALLSDSDLSDTDSDDEGQEGLVGHGAGLLMPQQLALHPMHHLAGVLDPHDHDGEFPVEPEEYAVIHD